MRAIFTLVIKFDSVQMALNINPQNPRPTPQAFIVDREEVVIVRPGV
jgi:hypothetical protein